MFIVSVEEPTSVRTGTVASITVTVRIIGIALFPALSVTV